MTDPTPKFNPIPRLQQIAATIEESGADIFDAPATAAYYINCAIKEIERLRQENDALLAERKDLWQRLDDAGLRIVSCIADRNELNQRIAELEARREV